MEGGMKKAFLTGLFVVMSLLFQAGGAWAENLQLPEGARRIDPIRIDSQIGAETSAHRQDAEGVSIPPIPDVFLYSRLTKRGAQLDVAVSMTFVPLEPVQTRMFINGQDILSVWSVVSGNGGSLPKGVKDDLKEYRQFGDIQMPFFLPVGTYDVEVRIFPVFKLPLYWGYLFSVRVDPFEFSAEQCVEGPDVVMVKYHIMAIGAPPRVVAISVSAPMAQLVTGGEVVNGVIEWHLSQELYNERLAGKRLNTTLQDKDTGATVTREVGYGSDLPVCNSSKGDGKG